MESNQKEFEILKGKIANLNWDNNNLYKHTIKHPIGDWQKENRYNNNQLYKLLWSNLLNIHDIPKDDNSVRFNDTKEAYRKVSLEVLSKLYNAIIFFHDGIKDDSGEKYRSIGLFDDREYKDDEKILVTYVRGEITEEDDNYYITTCYFKDRGFKEKFYYAYMLIKEPELFKISIDVNAFYDMNGIPKEFSFDKLEKLLDNSKLSEDKVGEIFNYYINNKKIDTDRYCYLKYLFNDNNYLKDIKVIENKLKINNKIITYLEEKRDQMLDGDNLEVLSKYDYIYQKSEDYYKTFSGVKANLKRKYSDDISVNDLCLRIVDNTKFDMVLDDIYIKDGFSTDLIDNLNYDCVVSLAVALRITSLKAKVDEIKDFCKSNNYSIKEYCENMSLDLELKILVITLMIKYIEEKNKLLYSDKDCLVKDMYMDDEELFYMSLYKSLAKLYSEYINADFDFENRYDKEINKIIDKYKNNN